MGAAEAAPAPRTRNARGEGERLREALLDAAAELLVEHGSAERLSIRSVTARAGVTPTALYLHFADKQELLHALLGRSWDELRELLERAERDHEGDPRAQLGAMARAYAAFALERPGLYRVLFGTYIPGGKIMPRGGAPGDPDPGLRTFDVLTRAVARCLADGRDPFDVAVLLWPALHGYVTLLPVMPSFPWPDTDRYFAELYRAYIEPR
jgi:AcrR family transcriptional regulator